jgi:membrane protein
VTLVCLIVLAIVLVSIVITGPVARAVGDAVGVGDAAVTVWQIAKWPVLFVLALGMLALLYYSSPNVKPTGIRWITPGTLLAVVIAVIASGAFALFVANFGSYNKTYGSLAGVFVFLVWLWLINTAVLLGAELDAELERERAFAAGTEGAERQIPLERRDEPG